MIRFFLSGFVFAGLAGVGHAETYSAPPECVHEATVRSQDCLTKHISVCGAQILSDVFQEERFFARKFYEHPTLFTVLIHSSGLQVGHKYGDGAPDWGVVVEPGERYEYRREVVRNFEISEPGDDGVEVMEILPRETMRLAGRDFTVLPQLFEVIGAGGDYRLVERAYVLDQPRIPLGGVSETFDGDGDLTESHDGGPVSISLPGEAGFATNTPPPHCVGVSS